MQPMGTREAGGAARPKRYLFFSSSGRFVHLALCARTRCQDPATAGAQKRLHCVARNEPFEANDSTDMPGRYPFRSGALLPGEHSDYSSSALLRLSPYRSVCLTVPPPPSSLCTPLFTSTTSFGLRFQVTSTPVAAIRMMPAFTSSSPLRIFAPALPHSSKCQRRPPHLSVATPPPPVRPSDKSSSNEHASPAQPLVGAESLQRALLTAPPEKLVVVMFHARWCRVCKTLGSKLFRVAEQFPDVMWLSIDFAELENKPLCAKLGVKLLPTFRFYKPQADIDQAVDHFTTGPFGAKRLVEHLEEQSKSGVLGSL
ncbi:thioredoxin [Gracilaria domingensis]|nr:thioredoxin [Gracilaria domingensis]